MLAAGLFGPIYAVFVEEIGGDLLTAGSAYSAFAIAAGILIFFISRWEDHVKHQEKLVVAGYALSCLGFLGYLLIREPWHLFVVQVIFGLGEAINTPAYDGLYSKHLDRGKFASEWGLWDSMYYITIGISAAIGGFLASLYGFRFLFVIMFFVSVIGLIISTFLVVRKKRAKRK
jgi:MFS family permease